MLRSDAKKRKVELTLEDHRKLRKMLEDLQTYLGQPRPEIDTPEAATWASTLSQKLFTLHEELARHFRLEEESGILGELSERYPRASGAIDRLLADHAVLLNELRGVTEATMRYSTGAPPDDNRLRRRTHALIKHLAGHEEAESELLQRLLYDDYGVGD